MSLTLAEARSVIQAGVAKAQEMGIGFAIAVVDEGGRLIAFARTERTIMGSIWGCQGKSIAAATFGKPSAELQGAIDTPVMQAILAGGYAVPARGAVPIIRNGTVIGACGCGGGTGEQDEDVARAAVAALGG